MGFDAVAYKETTREQWQTAAGAWNDWGVLLEDWLGEATALMLDLAGVGEGSAVLDVAASAGGQTLAAASRVGAAGRVLATDISPAILEFAAANARAAGFDNVDTLEADGETLAVEAGSFDAAISRVGLIYFPDQQRALSNVIAALRPGGRFATVTYSTPENNRFFSIPVGIIRRRAELPPPTPGQPGPFSLGADGVLAGVLEQAGFEDVEVRKVDSPVRVATADECVRFERESFGALHQMLAGLDEDGQQAAWDEIEEQLAQFETDGGFAGPCELLVGAGRKPQG